MADEKGIRAILLTGLDPWGEPRGGQTTFAKHLLKAFGNRLAVTSRMEANIPVGKWLDRRFNGQNVRFFNRGNVLIKNSRKPFVPARITSYFNARRWMVGIRGIGCRNLIVDCPELLFAAAKYNWGSVCYSFAGVNSPVSNSRYPWARPLGRIFERQFMTALKKIAPDVMIAAADQAAINEMLERTGYILDHNEVYSFPTRVDMDVFFPVSKEKVRSELGLPLDQTILVMTGRLCWIKGWALLLDVLRVLKTSVPGIRLIFVGDGEDHPKLQKRARKLGLSDNILITGFVLQSTVAKYINCADVCLVGSYQEGWSVAMCEIIACGQVVVSTHVSGARDMVHHGENGLIVTNRDPNVYADAVLEAMELKNAKEHSLRIAERYAVSNLAKELGAIWKPLSV